MKTIYIHGSFESNNFGDFLLYKLMIEAINEYCAANNTQIEVISDHISDLYLSFHHIATYPVLKAMKMSDAVVFTGGGYLGEPAAKVKNWNKHFLKSHFPPLFCSFAFKKKTAVLGVGAGPVSKGVFRRAIRSSLNNASVVSVRDNESQEFLKSIGVKNSVEVHPDWVLSNGFGRLLCQCGAKEDNNKAFIHITGTSQEKIDVFCESIKAIRSLYPDLSFIVGTDNTQEKQKSISSYIMKSISKAGDELYIYDNPYTLLNHLQSCRYIITDKLHVGICGVRMNKTVVPLPIHPKIRRFYNQIAYNKSLILEFDLITEEKLTRILKEAIDTNYTVNIDSFVSDAEENKKLLTDFLHQIA